MKPTTTEAVTLAAMGANLILDNRYTGSEVESIISAGAQHGSHVTVPGTKFTQSELHRFVQIGGSRVTIDINR